MARTRDIVAIAGIGKERATLLRSKGISTVEKLVQATRTDKELMILAEATGISVNSLKNWRTKARLLTRSE